MTTLPCPTPDFLASTPIIDARNPDVARLARDVTADSATDVERAQALFEWVRDRIPHSWDIRARAVTCRASEVLATGTGICFAKSHLLAALCRSVGLPAGLVYQRLRTGDPQRPWVLHGLNAIYLPSLTRWIRVDPRGNRPGVDAQFDLDEERLAFPPDGERGEATYDGIFAEPDAAVVAFLRGHTDLIAAWPHLPEGLSTEDAA